MTNNNNLKPIIENKKPFELVQEIDNKKYEIPSFEEFMKDYQEDEKANESYELEVDSYGGIGERKSCGPMYRASNNSFSIRYRFNHSVPNRKNYFEQSGSYSSVWSISGSWDDLYSELRKFDKGKIRVVFDNGGNYEINKCKEEEVKKQLGDDVDWFRKWRCGNPGNIEREFEDIVYVMSESGTKIYACPAYEPKQARS